MAKAEPSALQAPDIDVGEAPPEASPSTNGQENSVPSVLKKLHKWGEYEAMGQPLAGTKFIPMKTPLSEGIIANWSLPDPPKYRLTVSDLLAVQSAAGCKVGMILDLSNHECLYSDDIPATLAYRHVYLVAKELPSPSYVREVREVAQEFWSQHPDEYIGIHCAYGFNRTGFVVCSYLIEACHYSVDQALAAFSASRPPGIRHDYFRAELYRRYGGVPAPGLALSPAGPPGGDSMGVQAANHGSGLHGHAPAVTQRIALTTPPRVQVTHASVVTTTRTIYTTTSTASPVPVPGSAPAMEQPLLSPRLSPFSPLSQRPLADSMLADGEGHCRSANGHEPTGDAEAAAPLTPALSENESLGISDRIIMQSFRAHKMQAMTPEGIDSLMAAAAARMRQQHTPDHRLQRKSLGAVSWQADGCHNGTIMASADTETPESSSHTQCTGPQQLEGQVYGLRLT